jgi:hypothetical protein
MKHSDQLCAVAMLMLALAVSTFASQVDCPGEADPPPPTTTSDGHIDCPMIQFPVCLTEGVLLLP